MKKLAVIFASLLMLTTNMANAELYDSIIAVVDEGVITRGELEQRATDVMYRLERSGAEVPPFTLLSRQVLDGMIDTRILLKRAEETGIRVDDVTLNKTISNIAKDQNMNLEQFKQSLKEEGEDYATFREDIRQQLIIGRLQQREVGQKIKVSSVEVKQFLQSPEAKAQTGAEYDLSHVLVTLPQAATPAEVEKVKAAALKIAEKMQQGTTAKSIVAGGSKEGLSIKGGELGWRKVLQLPTLFVKPAISMNLNEVSEPIRSPSGYHVIKLLGKRDEQQKHNVAQTKVRHILVKIDEITKESEAMSQIASLYDELALKPSQFEQLARAYSDDKASAVRGGDLGWVNPGVLTPDFEKAMDNLQVGELSEPVLSPYGWHLIQVVDRRTIDDTEAYRENQARQAIYKRKFNTELAAWQQQMRDEAYVEIFL